MDMREGGGDINMGNGVRTMLKGNVSLNGGHMQKDLKGDPNRPFRGGKEAMESLPERGDSSALKKHGSHH